MRIVRMGLIAPAGLLLGEQSSQMSCEYVWLRSWEILTEMSHSVGFSKLLLLIRCMSFPLFKWQKPGHLPGCTSESSGILPWIQRISGFLFFIFKYPYQSFKSCFCDVKLFRSLVPKCQDLAEKLELFHCCFHSRRELLCQMCAIIPVMQIYTLLSIFTSVC